MALNTKAPICKRLSIGLLNQITFIFYPLPIAGKEQKMLKTGIFYDRTQTSLVGIFQYPTLSQCNKKGILPTIEPYTHIPEKY